MSTRCTECKLLEKALTCVTLITTQMADLTLGERSVTELHYRQMHELLTVSFFTICTLTQEPVRMATSFRSCVNFFFNKMCRLNMTRFNSIHFIFRMFSFLGTE